MSVTVEEALRLILQYTPVLEEEEAPLLETVGRVLCRDLCSAIQQPPFDRSPLDGYAVVGADLAGASPETPVVLKVVDKLYAGCVSEVPVAPGQAVRLMTGSMIPAGADCIIRQEDTDQGEDLVRIFKAVKAGSNFCHRGEEYGVGDCLVKAGRVMDAAAIAVAAGAGLTHLPVRRRMRAAIISTGDEVRQPGQPLPAGKIYDSNTAYLAARLHQLGAQVEFTESVGDDLTQIVSMLKRCEGRADLILTTGGVSVGQKDLIEAAVCAFGGQVIFHGVDMKPGMPTLFAVKGSSLILGLSGNPFSAAVPFELFMRPILARMTENSALNPRHACARADGDFRKRGVTRRFLRANCQDGIVSVPTEQSNGQMRSMIGCNCLIDVLPNAGEVHRGDVLNIIWL